MQRIYYLSRQCNLIRSLCPTSSCEKRLSFGIFLFSGKIKKTRNLHSLSVTFRSLKIYGTNSTVYEV